MSANRTTSPTHLLGALKLVLPALYLVGAIPVWLSFTATNPDGLANVWLAIYTFPFVLVGIFLLGLAFPYLPGGYYLAHGLYFWPAVVLLALGLYAVIGGVARLIRRR